MNIGEGEEENIGDFSVNMENLDQETQLMIAQLNDIMIEGRNTTGISFKKVDMKTLNRITTKINSVIELIQTENITQTNNLIKAAGVLVADPLGLKPYKAEKKKDPWWKRRIEGDIKQLRKDLNLLERVKKGTIGEYRNNKVNFVKQKHRIKRKGLTTVIEEI